jgi:hypothetical protein
MNFNALSVSKLKNLKRQVEVGGSRAEVVRRSAKAIGVVKPRRLNKSIVAVSPKVSTPRKPRATRKTSKEARKPESVSVAPPQTATGAARIETVSNDTPAAAPISASEIPVNIGVAA